MDFSNTQGVYFWGFLVVFGVVMYLISPKVKDEGGFFRGTDTEGRPASSWALMMSIFISWIFAKSVTNAANLGAAYGIVGGLAYATYWLSIPFAGWVIYRLRTREGATGMVPFLMAKYGRFAAMAFSAAILIRLYNEVWSNTAVVGGYYGESGSFAFIASALLFTAAVLLYSLKGGLRSSIFTDVIQAVVFVLFLGLVLIWIVPTHGPVALLTEGNFALDAGADLLLVALLQVLSYPFHDPVLTDRGFITREKTMLRAFVVAGVLGFFAILAFSLVGVHAKLEGIAAAGNAPAQVAKGLGLAGFFAMSVVMISSAASTLDSTFTSLSKSVAHELPLLAGRTPGTRAIRNGVVTMAVFALLGNLPMIAGTDILKATTLSGTMVIGLAPVFLLSRWVGFSPLSFHLAFWTGMTLGVMLALGAIPASWAIGTGKYGLLLGTNLYGLILCTAGFLLPLALGHRRRAAEAA
ncbi:sodium:solute symporter family transporter [Denitromonas halophila]|uniref:Sodium:solute symporter n=1 Tax=Denitromonas halophila TaxID=1629404 RepID=A0A557QYZ7_9RHOO|nr:sodium:solute symporter [Denitromonas halophila]TVO58127.1 sodium:solute symporter [Denitromonas halophila]